MISNTSVITLLNLHLYTSIAVATWKKWSQVKIPKNISYCWFFSILLRISYLKALLVNPDDLCRLQKVVVDVSKWPGSLSWWWYNSLSETMLLTPEESKERRTVISLTFFFLSFIYLAAPGLSCSTWDLVSWPGIEPRPSALGVQSLSHWTTREVPLPLPLTLELGSSGSSAHSHFTTLTCGYCWEEDKVYWGKWILCPWESNQFRQEITVCFHCQLRGIPEREASLEIIQSVFILQMGKLRPIIMPFARK